MKLVQLYLIGVFVMIAFLVGSTMWQYNQFQTNVKNLQFSLPQEFANIPNANDQLSQMMGQIQSQTQPEAQTGSDANTTSTAPTKTYTAPDNSFSFEYPADWMEQNNLNNGKILFIIYKNNIESILPTISYLTVEQIDATSANAAINQLKETLKTQKTTAKITESEIINGQQTIPVFEAKQIIFEPITKTPIALNNISAIIITSKNFYMISVSTQNDKLQSANEREAILMSVKINNKPEKNGNN